MKVAKHNSRRRRNPSIDRLSDLPDSILCHILSFLPTKLSVKTSILARRWRYLWSYVPTLDFDDEYEGTTVDRVLLLHKLQCIHTFRITDETYYEDHQIETWIRFAVERNVQNLHLHFDYIGEVPTSPQCLLTCKTLVDLRLLNCSVFPVSGVVCLPRLKILHLHFLSEYESLPLFLSGCPVLEELVLQLYFDYCSCKISSPTIKRLRLNFSSDESEDEDESEEEDRYDRLEIDTPALVYLNLVDDSNQHIKCGPLTSLTEADIQFGNYVDKGFPFSRSVVEFIDRLRNIQYLKLDLSHWTETAHSAFPAQTISFHNLTELNLTADCRLLSKFLENADNLQILTFQECCEEIEGWTEPPRHVPKCLSSHLRIIELVNIKGKKHELVIIKYFLRNAKVLERMEIANPGLLDSAKMINMLKKISLFQRRSRACKVAFVQVH